MLYASFSATGGSFTGTTATGADWSAIGGTADVFVGLAVLGALVAIAGQLAFVLNVYRTITSGKATVQEVMVERRGA